MPYTVHELANLAGVSVRTLHHYDAIGILRPSRNARNGYRLYGERDLLTLQQILFFRELDFPLNEVKRILASPTFDMREALRDQRKLLELKKKRLAGLMKTIDKTLKKITNQTAMNDNELYDDFGDEAMKAYSKEAKERWGNTEAYRQSVERYGTLSDAERAKLKRDADQWMKAVASEMHYGPKSDVIQKRIAEHYDSLRAFYEPNLELYEGLANMYVDDPRFTAYYEHYAEGLAAFMKEAMLHFIEGERTKKRA